MSFIDNILNRFFKPVEPLKPGVYHYQSPADAQEPLRMHLRVNTTGGAVLIVNASTVLHLNQSAAEFAYLMIQGLDDDAVVREIGRRYNVNKKEAAADYLDFKDRLDTLIHTPDLDPVTFLDFERQEVYSGATVAPYRLDCALTYMVRNASQDSVAPVERVIRELSTHEWTVVLQKAWTAGIPHVIFTGGEPTLRSDLVDLIAFAESQGQVTGLLTDGHKLGERENLLSLLGAGLDHVMLVLEPENELSWQALDTMLPEDIHITVHMTLTAENAADTGLLLARLHKLGIRALSLSANSPDLKDQLDMATQTAAELGFNLVWDLPAPYSAINPVALELQEAGEQISGAGSAWLYVEPDGDVLRDQGLQPVIGNLATEAFEMVWQRRNVEA